MWYEVLAFAPRPKVGTLHAATVIGVDMSISCVRLRWHGDEAGETSATIETQDASEHLRGVVATGGDAVRIDADVEVDTLRVAALRLMVNGSVLDYEMSRGGIAAEEHVVGLAMEVWRESKVAPPPASPTSLPSTPEIARPEAWKEEYPLFPHQESTLTWMRELEQRAPSTLMYAGNLRMSDLWYVDTESECFTPDPSWREAKLVGGVCADGTGAGKTATTLRIIAEDTEHSTGIEMEDACPPPSRPPSGGGSYVARGTLVIVPLNLVSQWQGEIQKFTGNALRVVTLVQGRDARAVRMVDLCNADVVLTTLHFLRASKPYAELVESALGGRPRTRAVLSAWARQANHTEPIVEAVYWRRVVVDEVHQVFEGSARDLRHVRLLTTRTIWGLTATPVLNDAELAQHLYLFLGREKAHHPNLLARLIAQGVRTGRDGSVATPTPELRLVQLSAEERLHLQHSDASSAEEVVKLCTFVDASDPEQVGYAESIEARFHRARDAELATLRATVEGHDRTVAILERASAELDEEADALVRRCAAGDLLAGTQVRAQQAAAEAHRRDLVHARAARDAARQRVERCEASAVFVRERLATLHADQELCVICLDQPSGVITPCAHLFCSSCVRRHLRDRGSWCPTCRAPLQSCDLMGVARGGGIGSKMARLGELVASLAQTREPVILFVQWKTMVRGVRAYLRGTGAAPRVLLLDGNVAQRTATLCEFERGGVLLLCLEDSFAGLHLPHARHVIFAHAIVGNRDHVSHLERQAIARCARTGQTGEVRAYSLVVADCEEERMWRRTRADTERVAGIS